MNDRIMYINENTKLQVIKTEEIDCHSISATLFDDLDSGEYIIMFENYESDDKQHFRECHALFCPLYELFRYWQRLDRELYRMYDSAARVDVELTEDRISDACRAIRILLGW